MKIIKMLNQVALVMLLMAFAFGAFYSCNGTKERKENRTVFLVLKQQQPAKVEQDIGTTDPSDTLMIPDEQAVQSDQPQGEAMAQSSCDPENMEISVIGTTDPSDTLSMLKTYDVVITKLTNSEESIDILCQEEVSEDIQVTAEKNMDCHPADRLVIEVTDETCCFYHLSEEGEQTELECYSLAECTDFILFIKDGQICFYCFTK